MANYRFRAAIPSSYLILLVLVASCDIDAPTVNEYHLEISQQNLREDLGQLIFLAEIDGSRDTVTPEERARSEFNIHHLECMGGNCVSVIYGSDPKYMTKVFDWLCNLYSLDPWPEGNKLVITFQDTSAPFEKYTEGCGNVVLQHVRGI